MEKINKNTINVLNFNIEKMDFKNRVIYGANLKIISSEKYLNIENENEKDLIDFIIFDNTTMFDYEENKSKIRNEINTVSIAYLEDEDDYEAFKNFNIDAWIKDLNSLEEVIISFSTKQNK
jgi:hypothetical protein